MFDLIFDTAATQIVSTIVGGLCAYFYSIIQKKKEEIAAKDEIIKQLIENDQAQLRMDLVNTYYVWLSQGYMPAPVRDSMYSCYERYHASGGNGFISEIMAKVKDMPTEAENNG